MTTRKLLTVSISLLILLSPVASEADLGAGFNQVGLFLSPDGTGQLGSNQIGIPFPVYLVLLRPADTGGDDSPLSMVVGFELTIFFDPAPSGTLHLLETILPHRAIDIGESKDISSGFVDFVVGMPDESAPPVVEEAVVLAEMQILSVAADPVSVRVGPYRLVNSIPGEMAIVGHSESGGRMLMLPMYPVSGNHGSAVFQFNGAAVPVESSSFGSVKALYR